MNEEPKYVVLATFAPNTTMEMLLANGCNAAWSGHPEYNDGFGMIVVYGDEIAERAARIRHRAEIVFLRDHACVGQQAQWAFKNDRKEPAAPPDENGVQRAEPKEQPNDKQVAPSSYSTRTRCQDGSDNDPGSR